MDVVCGCVLERGAGYSQVTAMGHCAAEPGDLPRTNGNGTLVINECCLSVEVRNQRCTSRDIVVSSHIAILGTKKRTIASLKETCRGEGNMTMSCPEQRPEVNVHIDNLRQGWCRHAICVEFLCIFFHL